MRYLLFMIGLGIGALCERSFHKCPEYEPVRVGGTALYTVLTRIDDGSLPNVKPGESYTEVILYTPKGRFFPAVIH